ncbi:hypothetical protein OG470_10375 [Micromonospora sp. NBC_00389]
MLSLLVSLVVVSVMARLRLRSQLLVGAVATTAGWVIVGGVAAMLFRGAE